MFGKRNLDVAFCLHIGSKHKFPAACGVAAAVPEECLQRISSHFEIAPGFKNIYVYSHVQILQPDGA